MAHLVYIDVSAKLENWTADSVIAMTDGKARVPVVSAAVKRSARAWLRERYPNRRGSYHAYLLLSILIYIVSGPDLEHTEIIVVDADYPGAGSEAKIKNELVPLMKRRQRSFSGRYVRFQQLKGTKADHLARQVFKAKDRQSYRHVTFEEIRRALEK